jgi:osmotically inducible lipoprotein OsmB
MQKLRFSALALGLLALGACSSLTPTQERTVAGGAAGVAAGTLGTVILGGCLPCGAVIGGAVGAGTGYAIEKVSEITR